MGERALTDVLGGLESSHELAPGLVIALAAPKLLRAQLGGAACFADGLRFFPSLGVYSAKWCGWCYNLSPSSCYNHRMGASYSEDLRRRVLAAVDGGMSKWRVHQTFGVSRTTIDDWLKLRAETGGIEAKTEYYRGRAPMVADTRELRAFLAVHGGKTLAQLTAAWEAATGQAVSVKTFHKTLQRLGYTRKKNATATASKTPTSAQPSSRRSRP
jgi:transposase